MSKRKTVAPANTATVTDYKAQFIAEFASIEAQDKELRGTINSRRIAFLDGMIAHYGASLIREAKDGGFDGNKMKSEDSIKAEAARHGVSVPLLKECAEVIAVIKKEGPFKWRDYLRAKFPATKGESSKAPKASGTDKADKADKAQPTGPDVATLVAANPQEARKVISILVAALNEAINKRKAGRIGSVRLQTAVKQLEAADLALSLDGAK